MLFMIGKLEEFLSNLFSMFYKNNTHPVNNERVVGYDVVSFVWYTVVNKRDVTIIVLV